MKDSESVNAAQATSTGTTVLVTGGAGFIGCALSHKLAANADRWVVLDSLHPQVHTGVGRPADLHEAAELVVGDVTDAAVWDAVLASASPDVVIHLAAETGTAQSLNEATRHAKANVVGTTELTDAFGRSGLLPRRIILSSSRAVYGEGTWRRSNGALFRPGQRSHTQLEAAQWDFPDAVSIPSTAAATVPTPTSVYGATKLAQENILSAWGSSRGVEITTLRLQNVYGPGQSLINPYTGIVSLFSQLARASKSIPLYEDGQITRDFVFIEDIADAFVATLALDGAEVNGTFDIGSGTGTTIARLAEIIAEFYGAPAPAVNGAFRDGDVRHAAVDIADSLNALAWSPRWTVEAGVGALQEWIATELDRAESTRG